MKSAMKVEPTMKDHATSRVALVVGGAQGLGRGIAQRLLDNGLQVVIADIDEAALAKPLAVEGGTTAVPMRVDVTSESSVAALMEGIDRRFGRLDVVVNSAGILGSVNGVMPTVEGSPLAVWERVLAVNLTGTFLVCRAAIPLLRRGGWGASSIFHRAPHVRARATRPTRRPRRA